MDLDTSKLATMSFRTCLMGKCFFEPFSSSSLSKLARFLEMFHRRTKRRSMNLLNNLENRHLKNCQDPGLMMYIVCNCSYSTLVRINFENGKLTAGHAQLQSDAYKAAKSSGRMNFREFAVVPKHANFFQRIGELAGMAMGTTLTDNANTGVIRYTNLDGTALTILPNCSTFFPSNDQDPED